MFSRLSRNELYRAILQQHYSKISIYTNILKGFPKKGCVPHGTLL